MHPSQTRKDTISLGVGSSAYITIELNGPTVGGNIKMMRRLQRLALAVTNYCVDKKISDYPLNGSIKVHDRVTETITLGEETCEVTVTLNAGADIPLRDIYALSQMITNVIINEFATAIDDSLSDSKTSGTIPESAKQILRAFGIDPDTIDIRNLGNGHFGADIEIPLEKIINGTAGSFLSGIHPLEQI